MIKKHLQVFIKSLTKFEICVLITNLVVGITLSVLNIFYGNNKNTWTPYLALFAMLFSIISCIFAAKKMILAFPTGIIGSIFMVPINYVNGLIGLMIMYIFNCIMQIILWIVWYKTSDNKIDIKSKKASTLKCAIYFLCLCICTAFFTYIETFEWFQNFWCQDPQQEKSLGIIDVTKLVFDAGTLIFTIGVFYPLIKKYNQIWWLYLLIDLFTFIVWTINLCQKGVNDFTAWFMIINTLSMTSLSLVSLHNWKIN